MGAIQDIMNSRRVTSGWANIAAMYGKDIKTIETMDKNRIKVAMTVNDNPFEFIYVGGI